MLNKKTYKLSKSLVAIDHIGSGGNAAVVRGFVNGETPREIALKLLDPRWVTADDMKRDFKKFEHPNLLKIEKWVNLSDLGFSHIPDWYSIILNCEPKSFVSHPVADCFPNSDDWQRRPNFFSSQTRNDKTLAEFALSDFFILIMEYCPMSLSEYILKHSRSMQEVRRILTEVCAGLTIMHNGGITHSDLAIDNILIASDGVAKIADFGSSKPLDKEGVIEEINDLGRLAFQLATGENLLEYNLMDPYEDINSSNVPTNFVAICKKAAGNDTSSFDTVDEFADALKEIR